MPLRVLNAAGQGDWARLVSAVAYAGDHDADVVNISIGQAYAYPRR